MDITKENFESNFANMVFLAGRSTYIAVDLEMTGITTRKPHERRAQTVEEVYEGARQAASTFQAIQLGLTFVCFVGSVASDPTRQTDTPGEYKTFTVSIPISPMFATDDPVLAKMAEVTDRQISFSQASLLALERHGFDVKETLGKGSPYLSREELVYIEKEMLHDKEYEHIDPETVGDWGPKFYNNLRQEISDWLKATQTSGSTGFKFRVFNPQGSGTLRKTTVKLVHQLVREEFPTLRCARDRTDVAMTIRLITEEDTREKARQKQQIRKKIEGQLGISWLMEVLFDLDVHFTATGNHYTRDYSIFESEVDIELLEALGLRHKESSTNLVRRAHHNRPVWIGHNILHDLCFLHTTFIGKLPKDMGLFHERIRQTFPRVLDTKVMTATMTDPDAVDETLEDLFSLFKLQDYPRTQTIPGWGYNVQNRSFRSNQEVAHEAGFDSYMTAMVFLKSAFRQLELQKELFDEDLKHSHTGHYCERPKSWLQDPAREDPSLFPRATQVSVQLPSFDSSFFMPVANKLRMSVVGVMDLAAPPPLETSSIPRHDL